MKLLQNIFSITNNDCYKIICILGIKLKIKDKLKDKDDKTNKKYSLIMTNLEYLKNKYYQDLCPSPRNCHTFIDKLGVKNSDFQNDLLKLLKNCDKESDEVVSKILNRLQQYKNNNSTKVVLSINEYNEIQEWNYIRNNLILDLGNNIYKYKNYLLPYNFFECSVFYKKHDIEILKTLNVNKSIIDVGGFIGDSALIFSQYTNEKVYSFEPVTNTFNLLTKTLELNNLKNVIPIKKGLSDKNSIMQINANETVPGATSLINTKKNKTEKIYVEEIETTTLDEFVGKNNINVGLIKVDIEGAEQLFLKGAEKTIKAQKPILMLSIYHNYDDFMHIKTIIESWKLGYTFKIRKGCVTSMLVDTMLIAEVEK